MQAHVVYNTSSFSFKIQEFWMEVLQSRFEVKIIFSNFSYADIHTTDSLSIVLATTDQRRDGCHNATHLFEPNYFKFGLKKLVRGCPYRMVLILFCSNHCMWRSPSWQCLYFFVMWVTQNWVLKRPLKIACYFSSNLTFSPWQSVGSTWSRQVSVLSARYEYLTVINPSNLSSIRLVWQVSCIGAPFTEKKIETKTAAANGVCRNKMKARQRKISRQQLPSALHQQENRNLKNNNRWHLEFHSVLYMLTNPLAFGHLPLLYMYFFREYSCQLHGVRFWCSANNQQS